MHRTHGRNLHMSWCKCSLIHTEDTSDCLLHRHHTHLQDTLYNRDTAYCLTAATSRLEHYKTNTKLKTHWSLHQSLNYNPPPCNLFFNMLTWMEQDSNSIWTFGLDFYCLPVVWYKAFFWADNAQSLNKRKHNTSFSQSRQKCYICSFNLETSVWLQKSLWLRLKAPVRVF